MKVFISLILSIAILLSMTSCGSRLNDNVMNETSSDTAASENTAAPFSTESETTSAVAELTVTESTTSVITTVAEETTVVETTPIAMIDEVVVVDDRCDFFIDYIDITNDVTPPSASGYYSHYVADEGKAYVDICISYKNTATSDVSSDDVVDGTLIYDNKYEYSGFIVSEEDNRGDFTYYSYIVPLGTEYIHYLFDVPEEVANSEKPLEAKLKFGSDEYRVIIRDGESSAENNDVEDKPASNTKTSGNVTIGETISTENAEFSIEYADITKDVVPPSPDRFYSHYEADDGKVYIDICFEYKNLSSKKVSADEVFSAKMKYADKYEYSGFSTIEEDNRGDFTYSSITSISPLSTEYIHFLFNVPEEVSNTGESIVITFSVDRNTYTFTLR